ncbi:MAG: hypothetical protein EPO24_07840 [Bacteroidetes bacterium]|nr:MAG: hypothetical protein EPO24_07840 [Bacteroidota bacterium]
MMPRSLFVLLICLLSLSCENENPLRTFGSVTPIEISQEQLLHATTARSKYYLREQIRITIYNGSDSIIYIPTCARQITYSLQKFTDGTWKDISANGLPCIGFNSYGNITLFQGRSYVHTTAIVYFGTYRFRYPVTLGEGAGTFWLYTNEFSVDGR